MSPRVAYWATSFEGDIEAVASEVACLRRAFPKSVTWGVSSRRFVQCSWRRGFSVHPRLHFGFRAATWALQRLFELNHLFGSAADWFNLSAVRRRPAILTVAVDSGIQSQMLGKIDRFVVEWPSAKTTLMEHGVEAQRIEIVYPPVDLKRFCYQPAPNEPFTVLFASSPEQADWLSARGVDLLLDAARLRPRMRFRLVWRPWGNSLATLRTWIQQRELQNVDLIVGRIADMGALYQASHVTIAPFTDMSRCKPSPNSLVESLSSGRPIVATEGVGLADLVKKSQSGVICGTTAESIVHALDRVEADWNLYSKQSRRLAENELSEDRFVGTYRRIYSELLAE